MPSVSPLIILVIIVVLLCSGTYVQYAISPEQEKKFSFEPVIPYIKQLDLPSSLPPTPKAIIPEACKQVDFQWLASDRSFWDGWVSKSMFMRKDGKFTRKNVHINEGESVCITVLLGPIPAVSSIKAMSHFAPSDSIVMTAKSESTGTRIPITLQQHDKQTNAYFASVKFSHHDTYTLDTSVEYRSYFWEQPNFHKYLPNKFSSRNRLTVFKNPNNNSENKIPTQLEDDALVQDTKKCNFIRNPSQLLDSIWMEKTHYQQIDPIGFYNSEFNSMASDLVFVPQCELKPISACFNPNMKKTIHVWGDRHTKRNVQFLKGDILPTNLCNNEIYSEQVDTPIQLEGANIYFGEMNSVLAQDTNQMKLNIQGNSHRLPSADIVLLGIGNEDVASTRQSPNEFAAAFNSLLNYLIQQVYTKNEMIIIKTTQYYGSSWPNGGWSHGRSDAYANIIRSSVLNLPLEDKIRVILWDTHQLGLNENSQVCDDKSLSTSTVIKVENTILSNIIYKNGNSV